MVKIFDAIANLFKPTPKNAERKRSKFEPAPRPANCPLHQTPLKSGTAEIRYGLIATTAEDIAAAEQFPYANSWVRGGCYVGVKSPKRTNVQFCKKCRVAEAEWRRTQS